MWCSLVERERGKNSGKDTFLSICLRWRGKEKANLMCFWGIAAADVVCCKVGWVLFFISCSYSGSGESGTRKKRSCFPFFVTILCDTLHHIFLLLILSNHYPYTHSFLTWLAPKYPAENGMESLKKWMKWMEGEKNLLIQKKNDFSNPFTLKCIQKVKKNIQ